MEISDTENRFPVSSSDDDRPEMEYRSPYDEAWYSVELVLLYDVLVVRYRDFPSDYDDVFPASEHFSSSEDIRRFAARFRPTFVQMQDAECPTLAKGAEVCATCPSDSGDVKFYDATVTLVERAKHTYRDKREEACRCSFWLSWNTGPLVGKETRAEIDDICLRPKDNRVDPILLLFLKKAKDHLPEHARNVLEGSGGSAEHQPSSRAEVGLLIPGTSPHTHGQMQNRDSQKHKLSLAPQQQLPTNNLDFYSMQRARKKGKFAVRTTEGRIHGMCKKF